MADGAERRAGILALQTEDRAVAVQVGVGKGHKRGGPIGVQGQILTAVGREIAVDAVRVAAADRRVHGCVDRERAALEIARPIQYRSRVAIFDVHGDVAAVIGCVSTHQNGGIGNEAVELIARDRHGIDVTGASEQRIERAALAVLIATGGFGDLEALEVADQMEIHDACDGVRAVYGGGAAGQHIHAAHEGGWNEVDVGGGAVGVLDVAWAQAKAVDQHQGAGRAETAQIQIVGPGGVIGGRHALTGVKLRQPIEQGLNIGGALIQDLVGVYHRNGTLAGQVRCEDARPGNFDHLQSAARTFGAGGIPDGLGRPGRLCRKPLRRGFRV